MTIHQKNKNIWGAPFSVSTTINFVDAEEAIAVIPPLGNVKTGLGKRGGNETMGNEEDNSQYIKKMRIYGVHHFRYQQPSPESTPWTPLPPSTTRQNGITGLKKRVGGKETMGNEEDTSRK